MTKTLISLFTGHTYILGRKEDKFYVSTNTEKHEFFEIKESTYNENFNSCLVHNIIKL